MARAPAGLIAAVLLGAAGPAQAGEPGDTLRFYRQELDTVALLLEAGERHPAGPALIRGARLIDPRSGTFRLGETLRVRDGRIVAMDAGSTARPGERVIDASGAWIAPGLADLHVHHGLTAGQHLLHLLTGVTTVREMVGFPWMLEWRRQSAADEWIAPSLIVASHIIASHPLGPYATVVDTPKAARAAVRDQAAAGFDAIKVHNALAPALFDAVADEARRVRLPLVGHVPHEVSVARALAAGLTTAEHFKGWLDDRTLEISDEDWEAPTWQSRVWLTPTFHAAGASLSADEAAAWADSEPARYVPATLREQWLAEGPVDPADPVSAARRAVPDKQREIMARLLPGTRRFLAGTDSGGYPFLVPGFALYEELDRLVEAGLSPAEALAAATVNGALATRREGEFGELVLGARADLVMFGLDPNLRVPDPRDLRGVMIRGRWLDAAALADLRARFAAVCARAPPADAWRDAAWRAGLAQDAQSLAARGYRFPPHQLGALAAALEAAGDAAAAAAVTALSPPAE